MGYQVGESVGDYQIIGILGAGGMGKVYKVKNQISDRVDALKVLLPNLADDPELADRFIREIKVLARLNHPNIAGLRTAFRQENQLLMVMEYVEGTSLDERCKQGQIPMEDAISFIQQALAALGYAHKQGVIHRDIKPANMMLTPDNVVKLMDFGIAKTKSDKKLTQTGTTMGSLFYMSAEQVQGNELDGRSDLYSIGVSLYEMVTGTRPFQGKSDFDIMIAQLQQTPQPPMQMMPHLPKALNDIIMTSLEKDPAKRFQTAEAFSNALGSIGHALNATPVQAAAGTADTPTITAPGASGIATGMVAAQAAPPTTTGPTVAVGGAPPTAPVYTPTANIPTVVSPQPQVAAVAPTPPQISAPAMRPPGASKGYRGLYMALGALIVVAVLAVAALYVPRYLKARAGGDQSAQASQTSSTSTTPGTPASSPGTQPQAGAQTSTPATGPAAGGAGAGAGNSAANTNPPSATTGATAGGGAGLPATAGAITPRGGQFLQSREESKDPQCRWQSGGGRWPERCAGSERCERTGHYTFCGW